MTVHHYRPSIEQMLRDQRTLNEAVGMVCMSAFLCACSVAVGMIGVGVLSAENCRPSVSYSSRAFAIGSVPGLGSAFFMAVHVKAGLDKLCRPPAIESQIITRDNSLSSTSEAIVNVLMFNPNNFKDILVFTAAYIVFLGGLVVGCILPPKDDEIPSCRPAVFLEYYPLLQHVAGMATLLAFTGTMRGLQYGCTRAASIFESRTNVTDFHSNRLPASPSSFC